MVQTMLREAVTTNFLWLELTGRCQLNCVHCYADSGPAHDHGAMSTQDWLRTVDQATEHGISQVCMIGGEPTAHPAFAELLSHTLASGMNVEVFTNLFHVTERLWSLFILPGVSLATSYYSDDSHQHDAITARAGSYVRTRANIAEAVRRQIPIRVGIIELSDVQRSKHARTDLISLGVSDAAIGSDRLRAFGRGAVGLSDEADNCGRCGHGSAAVLPDGSVTPCVFTRTATAGSVRTSALGQVLGGTAFAAQVARLDALRPGLTGSATRDCIPECYPRCAPLATCSPQVPPALDEVSEQSEHANSA